MVRDWKVNVLKELLVYMQIGFLKMGNCMLCLELKHLTYKFTNSRGEKLCYCPEMRRVANTPGSGKTATVTALSEVWLQLATGLYEVTRNHDRMWKSM